MKTSYEALTLGEYMKIDGILRSDADDIDKQVGIIAILSGKSEDEVLTLPLPDYMAMVDKAEFLKRPYTASRKTAKAKRFTIGGREYVPTLNPAKLTTAQYVDFQTFCKGGISQLPELLGVLLVPAGHAYNDGYDMADVLEDMKGMPMPMGIDLGAFLLMRWKASMEGMLTSLTRQGSRAKGKKKAQEIMAQITEVMTLLRFGGAGSPR